MKKLKDKQIIRFKGIEGQKPYSIEKMNQKSEISLIKRFVREQVFSLSI
jgi:hypothetical protein